MSTPKYILMAVVLPVVLGISKCPLDLGLEEADRHLQPNRRTLQAFDQSATAKLDFTAVMEDIKKVLTDSQDWWPADDGNYGPLMIRMAWHCAGTYRLSDGRGGCEGARQRFEPEESWPDNTNLDKARALLWPVKEKYGPELTWGDLIVLAGTTAIESLGGPVLGFCAGRIDDADGEASLPLGPTAEQELVNPCTTPGDCQSPLGQSTMGLIYVNPEGPMGVPDPTASAKQIREVFGRMGMNDSETVALIGGGHAFGRTHGACPTGPGPSPKEDPANPWPGTCGEGDMKGKGPNTFTSGFEGPWTVTPSTWGNEYYTNLLTFDWEVHEGPGGHQQWRPKHFEGTPEGTPLPEVMMLTADVALLYDDTYKDLVIQFASDQDALDNAFKHAWYKLMTRDMGPVTRCLGTHVPPAQPFQFPLPPPPAKMPEWKAVRADVIKAMWSDNGNLPVSTVNGKPYVGDAYIWLAGQAGRTYRESDHTGGPNGAYYRFPPLSESASFKTADKILADLKPIKDKYGASLTWADLVVFAGTVALEESSTLDLKFCPGRSDAEEGSSGFVEPPSEVTNTNLTESAALVVMVRDMIAAKGWTNRDFVALGSLPRSDVGAQGHSYTAAWGGAPNKMTNQYYHVLLDNRWKRNHYNAMQAEYVATDSSGKEIYMTDWDMAIAWDPVLRAIAQGFAIDKEDYRKASKQAWTKLMNADRFNGPAKSACSS